MACFLSILKQVNQSVKDKITCRFQPACQEMSQNSLHS